MAAIKADARPDTGTEITISLSGDILAHPALIKQATTPSGYDFDTQLSRLSALLIADINICHMETPLTSHPPSGYPIFSVPTSLARSLKNSGFDGCSTASNHSLDMREEGVRSTINAFTKLGMQTAGTRKQASDSGVGIYVQNGITVAHLAYTFSTNGLTTDKPWLINMLDGTRIINDAKTAKKYANIVIVSIHWGTEYSAVPNNQQKYLAKILTASGYIDAIGGHHSHVLQSAEIVNGKPVFYGLGNLWSGQGLWSEHPTGNIGVIVTINFQVTTGEVQTSNIAYQPTIVMSNTWQVIPANEAKGRWTQTACLAIKNTKNMFGKIGTTTTSTALFAERRCS